MLGGIGRPWNRLGLVIFKGQLRQKLNAASRTPMVLALAFYATAKLAALRFGGHVWMDRRSEIQQVHIAK